MTYPQTYSNPPIVEAVVEFGFETRVSSEVAARLRERFSSEYSGVAQTQRRVALQPNISGSEITATATTLQEVHLLPSKDGKRVVGLAEHSLSVHVLAPYPGWTAFLSDVRAAFSTFGEIAGPVKLLSVGVRYIDRIVVPATTSLTELFTILPPRPNAMPDLLSAFHVVLQSQDTAKVRSVLALTSAESEDPNESVVLYDLNLLRSEPSESWETDLQHLHARQREIFEQSITEKTRELFK
nr:TIGR04255 family protein [Nannocystis pusilla]